MFGYTEAEFANLALDDLHPAGSLGPIHRDIGLATRARKPSPMASLLCIRKDGSTFRADVRGGAAEVGGRMVAFGFFTDVTERLRATRRLALQADMGRILAEAGSLAEAVPRILQTLGESEGMTFGAWWELDPDTGDLHCAHTWCLDPDRCGDLESASRTLAIRAGEGIPGRVWASRSILHVRDLGEAAFRAFVRGPVAVAAGLRSVVGFPLRRRGEVAGVLEFFAPEIRSLDPAFEASIEMLGGQIALYLERQRAQEESARYVAASPAVLYALRVVGSDFRVGWFSDNVETLTGHAHAEVEANAARWWRDGIHANDRERVAAANASAVARGVSSVEFRFRRKDGSWVWIHDEKRVLRDDGGAPSEIVGSWVDITDRMSLEQQLRQSQKMEAVGQLAGGVAHDFNNLLTVISGNCDILLTGFPPDDPKRGPLTDIRAAGERAANLTRQLLAFSRKQLLEPRLVDVHDVLRDMERMLRRLIGEDIDLETDFAADPSWVKVDPGQLEQVVMNLAVNARDAMPRGGRVTLRTRTVEPSEAPDADETAGRRLRPRVAISIRDTGTGITPEVKARLFEPFFTTKAVGKGTGLGLATVYGIVKQSGGDITVESEPGKGSTFTVVLPSQPPPRGKGSGASLHAAPRGTETVLAVEDEDAVRRIVRIALESTGYRVLEARSGPEALVAAARHGGKIDLVLTDVVMPEMSGRELAERIRKEKPGIRILYMSGYTDDAIMRHGIVESGVAFLQKPFSPLVLARKVREVLDAPA
jgi:PAS domain S-box-containing protein